MNSINALALAGVGSLVLAACGPAPRPETAGNRAPDRAAEQAHPIDLTHGQGFFTARFYSVLAQQAGPADNLFISPLSLSQGLGLGWLGAKGQTAEEMRSVLGWWEGNPAALTSRSNSFLMKMDDPKVEIRIANALWLAKTLPVRSEYLVAAKSAYGAEPTLVDFDNAPDTSAKTINGWVSGQTNGRITEIVKADQFDRATAAVLTNAVYFKADWQAPFEKSAEGTFTTDAGIRKPITLMERVAPMQYRETSEGQAVTLPYGNGRYVMEVFLPRNAAILRHGSRSCTVSPSSSPLRAATHASI